MTHKLATAASVIGMLGAGGAAQAGAYFQFTGGAQEAEQVVSTGNFVPVGAMGYDSYPATPLGITLEYAGHTGETMTIRLDYIGRDASYVNQFTSGGVQWCNQTSGCGAGYDAIGDGNRNWYTNFARTAYITMTVGDFVPLSFTSDLLNQGGNGTHTTANPGPTSDGANYAAFMWNGALNGFDMNNALTQGTVFGVGLSDGAANPNDDDHQDFTVKVSIVPEPAGLSLALLGLAGLALVSRRRRAKA